ncbi:hypothetical protein PSYAE_22918 [Pseudomonas amygdali pv. aesculi str. 0893_23]|nr:hypothetical protein PSYAE_22918 [Pseudomonas amygdali pv. aesculi str. 0893_23]RMS23046.1 hypothetical protein ALP71_102989 [Pseudomonas coronafaciens pv. garcae]
MLIHYGSTAFADQLFISEPVHHGFAVKGSTVNQQVGVVFEVSSNFGK